MLNVFRILYYCARFVDSSFLRFTCLKWAHPHTECVRFYRFTHFAGKQPCPFIRLVTLYCLCEQRRKRKSSSKLCPQAVAAAARCISLSLYSSLSESVILSDCCQATAAALFASSLSFFALLRLSLHCCSLGYMQTSGSK